MARADMRLWVALGAAVVLVGGCSRSDAGDPDLTRAPAAPEGLVACDEIYGDEKVVDDETFGQACAQGDEMVVPRPIRLTCTDQRKLYWNDFAWGYLNEPMTMIDPQAPEHEQVPYETAIECIKASAADQQAMIRNEIGLDDEDVALAGP